MSIARFALITLVLVLAACESEPGAPTSTATSQIRPASVARATSTPPPTATQAQPAAPSATATTAAVLMPTAPATSAPAPTATNTLAPTSTPEPAPGPSGLTEAQLSRVIDGDTIAVSLRGEQSVRLIGVDTPETVHPSRDVECYGPEAAEFTRTQIAAAGNRVFLERDVSDSDRYGRLLRYVWLDLPQGRVMLNELLVREGYAQVSTFPPDVQHVDPFIEAQREAREQSRGLWAACLFFGAPVATEPPPATLTAAPGGATAGVEFIEVQDGRPGGNARVTVQTAPGATCTINYVTPAGTVSQARGLVPKVAGGNGRVSWSWVIGTRTQPGTGIVTVSCNGATASAPIQIS